MKKSQNRLPSLVNRYNHGMAIIDLTYSRLDLKALFKAQPPLRLFAHMSDSELRDQKQLIGIARATRTQLNEEGLFIAESRNVIERALNAGLIPFTLISERRWLIPHRDLFERIEDDFDIPLYLGKHDVIEAITGFKRTVGPIAAFHRPPLPKIDELLKSAKRIAILEDITNYTNIGSIFRSAAALGLDAVLITPGCHDPYYRRAARVSMGSVFQIPWTRIGEQRDWASKGVPFLHELGFTVAALALKDDSLSLRDPRLAEADKLALVLGTEGDGLTESTISSCDHTVRIPMSHGVDSLNVAAASAIAFWEVCFDHLAVQ